MRPRDIPSFADLAAPACRISQRIHVARGRRSGKDAQFCRPTSKGNEKSFRMPGAGCLKRLGRKMQGFDCLAFVVQFSPFCGNPRSPADNQRKGADGCASWSTTGSSGPLVTENVPARLDYRLSDAGNELVPVMEAMCNWGTKLLGFPRACLAPPRT